MKNKILIGLCAGIAAISLASCGGNNNNKKDDTSDVLNNKYSVTYVTNFGTAPEKITDVLALPQSFPSLSYEGYDFNGWYLDITLVNKAVEGAAIAGDITLYAKWTAKAPVVYNVTYVSIYGDAIQPLNGVVSLPSTLPQPTQDGYDFEGWYLDNAFTQKAEAGSSLSADVRLYAKWIEAKYNKINVFDVEGYTLEFDSLTTKITDAEFEYIKDGGYKNYPDYESLIDFSDTTVTNDNLLDKISERATPQFRGFAIEFKEDGNAVITFGDSFNATYTQDGGIVNVDGFFIPLTLFMDEDSATIKFDALGKDVFYMLNLKPTTAISDSSKEEYNYSILNDSTYEFVEVRVIEGTFEGRNGISAIKGNSYYSEYLVDTYGVDLENDNDSTIISKMLAFEKSKSIDDTIFGSDNKAVFMGKSATYTEDVYLAYITQGEDEYIVNKKYERIYIIKDYLLSDCVTIEYEFKLKK